MRSAIGTHLLSDEDEWPLLSGLPGPWPLEHDDSAAGLRRARGRPLLLIVDDDADCRLITLIFVQALQCRLRGAHSNAVDAPDDAAVVIVVPVVPSDDDGHSSRSLAASCDPFRGRLVTRHRRSARNYGQLASASRGGLI